MLEVRRTTEFAEWLANLRDGAGAARIIKRIERIRAGNFGDRKSVGDGVSELRFDFGPGYRVYYTCRGDLVVLLLCGGDKSSQAGDVEQAKLMARDLA